MRELPPMTFNLRYLTPVYLCNVIHLKRGLALRVEVAVALELIKFTDNDLPHYQHAVHSQRTITPPPDLSPVV